MRKNEIEENNEKNTQSNQGYSFLNIVFTTTETTRQRRSYGKVLYYCFLLYYKSLKNAICLNIIRKVYLGVIFLTLISHVLLETLKPVGSTGGYTVIAI